MFARTALTQTRLLIASRASSSQPSHFLKPFSSSSSSFSDSSKHTSDTYAKDSDTDTTPPSDSQIHRLDPSSENVQKPHEAPSGEWSRAGVKTDEYKSVSKKEPYKAKGPGERYGAVGGDPEGDAGKEGQGPTGESAGGRKA